MQTYELDAPKIWVFLKTDEKNDIGEYVVEHAGRWADRLYVAQERTLEEDWNTYSRSIDPKANVYSIILDQWDIVVDYDDMKAILSQERDEPRKTYLFQRFYMWGEDQYRVDGVWVPALYPGPFPFRMSRISADALPYEIRNSPVSSHVVSRVMSYKYYKKKNRMAKSTDDEQFISSLTREPTLARWTDGGIPRGFSS